VGRVGTVPLVPPMVGALGRACRGRARIRPASAARCGASPSSWMGQRARDKCPRAYSKHGEFLRPLGHTSSKTYGPAVPRASSEGLGSQHGATDDEGWWATRGCATWSGDTARRREPMAGGAVLKRSQRGSGGESAGVPAARRAIAAVPGKWSVAERQPVVGCTQLRPALYATTGARPRRGTSNGHTCWGWKPGTNTGHDGPDAG